jgi:hypothetical protein
VRSEYIYRKKLHDRFWYIPPWVDIALEFIELNRLFIYIILFFMGDCIRFYFSYRQQKKEKLELELLKQSFEVDELRANPMSLMSMVQGMDAQEGDDQDIVFDFRNNGNTEEGGSADKEAIKKALNEYINERLREVAQDYHVQQFAVESSSGD